MSRVGHCIDTRPVESFQGIFKDILRILHTDIHTYEEIEQAIYETIDFYIHKYPQARLNGKTAYQARTKPYKQIHLFNIQFLKITESSNIGIA